MKVKTRFAPSPSGELHIGNLRAALIPFIFAKKNRGVFFLRIDNTNINTYSKDNVINIIDTIKKFKIKFKYLKFQSKKARIYIKFSNILIRKKKAYIKEGAVYYKVVKKDTTVFNDLLRGKIKIKNSNLKDFVIIRKNGFATFNFACAIDDYIEKVNFVFRGEEHITNTVKQIIILNNFGYKNIKYIHIPNILDKNGEKISKRKEKLSLKRFLKKGIMRMALINYTYNLGMSNYDELYYKFKEIKKKFNVNKIKKSSSKYDFKKIFWYNKKHILKIKNKKIIKNLKKKFNNQIFFFKKSIKLIKKRSSTLNDLRIIYKKYFYDFLYVKKILEKKIIFIIKKIFKIKWEKKNIALFLNSKKNKIKDLYLKLNLFFFNEKINVPSIIDVLYIIGKKNLLNFFVLFI